MKFAVLWILLNLIFSNLITSMLPENSFRFLIGMWMPAVSAILFLKIEKKSIAAGINWKLGSLKAYGSAAAIPAMIAILTVLMGLLTGRLVLNRAYTLSIVSSFLTFLIWIFSSLGEEIGWRGYLHQHFKELKHGPLFIGVIWGAWHLRDLLSQGSAGSELISFLGLTVLISYFLSWLIESGGSVIACGLFHGVWNFLRLKILFGNPAHGTTGYFLTVDSAWTEMEGYFGLVATVLVVSPFIFSWYRRHKRAGSKTFDF